MTHKKLALLCIISPEKMCLNSAHNLVQKITVALVILLKKRQDIRRHVK